MAWLERRRQHGVVAGMAQRKLWLKLPSDVLIRLLGAPPDTRMLLHKPVYGQLDAPKRWYMEACRRLRALGCIAGAGSLFLAVV